MGRPRVDPVIRFLSKIRKTRTCWLWTGNLNKGGYGQFFDGTRTTSAHRFSYQHFIGPIPENLGVLHKCDVGACVKPAHFYLGTALENQRDKWKRGRGKRMLGKLNGCYGKPAWNRGKKMPEGTGARISDKCKGRVPWNKGLAGRPGTDFKVKAGKGEASKRIVHIHERARPSALKKISR